MGVSFLPSGLGTSEIPQEWLEFFQPTTLACRRVVQKGQDGVLLSQVSEAWTISGEHQQIRRWFGYWRERFAHGMTNRGRYCTTFIQRARYGGAGYTVVVGEVLGNYEVTAKAS